MSNLYYPKNKPELKQIFTPEDAKRCKEDPVYFVNKYGWTFDPRPTAPEHHLRFKLYPFQEEYLLWIILCIKEGKDGLTEKSRDMGVSWLHMAAYLWCWLYLPGFQCLIGSRKEDLVDNGLSDSLFGKIDYLLERLPFQPKGYDSKKHRTYMRLINPVNGNSIKGESANAEFSRQGRYSVVFMDEVAFWERPESAWTASGEATKCRMGVTTPPKQRNFVTALRNLAAQQAIATDLKTLHWRLHPLKDEAWYEEQKLRKLPEELAQEIDINWEGSITGRVYPEIEHVRVGNFPYRVDLPLYVSHDPGATDPYALVWWQSDPATGRVRLVDCFERGNKIVDWFAPLFGAPLDSQFTYTKEEYDFIQLVKEWKGAIHYGDPYGENKNSNVTRQSAFDRWRDFNIYVQTNTKANNLEIRKTELKRVLMHLDVNDTPRTRYWMECMKNSKYPDLPENSQRVTPNVKPIHDWTSHMRTASEYFAVNFKWDIVEKQATGFTFEKAAALLDKVNAQQRYLH